MATTQTAVPTTTDTTQHGSPTSTVASGQETLVGTDGGSSAKAGLAAPTRPTVDIPQTRESSATSTAAISDDKVHETKKDSDDETMKKKPEDKKDNKEDPIRKAPESATIRHLLAFPIIASLVNFLLHNNSLFEAFWDMQKRFYDSFVKPVVPILYYPPFSFASGPAKKIDELGDTILTQTEKYAPFVNWPTNDILEWSPWSLAKKSWSRFTQNYTDEKKKFDDGWFKHVQALFAGAILTVSDAYLKVVEIILKIQPAEAKKKMEEKAKEVVDKTKEVAHRAGEASREAAGNVVDAARKTASLVGETVTSIADKAEEKGKAVLHSTAQSVEQGARKVAEQTKSAEEAAA